MKKEILIIAGEESGDMHGAALIAEMNSIDPELSFFGIGGDKMRDAGMQIVYHIREMAFLGFTEVVKRFPFIFKVRSDLLKITSDERIKLAILIDYPGFNLSIAKKLKKQGVKIVYYISPQVWAWGKKRINKIKKLVDKLIVIFPFEKEFFEKENIDVEFVGHPLIERVHQYQFVPREEFFSKFNLDRNKEILLILPGSRKQEIERIFPAAIEAADLIAEEFDMQIVTACANSIDENIFKQINDRVNYSVVKNFTFELLKYSKFGLIKSGTSTIESAVLQLPFIVLYSTSKLTYLIGKQLIKIDKIAMANIIAGKKIVGELIQSDVNAKNIREKVSAILSDEKKYSGLKTNLRIVTDKLGTGNASKKSAQIICDILDAA